MVALDDIAYEGPAGPVQGYGPGFFRLNDRVWRGPVLLTPEGPRPWSGLGETEPLLALAGRVDVLLLGMGAAMGWPSPGLSAALAGADLPVEPMPTPSACRTWNMLLAEGRRTAAALVPV